MKRRNQVFGKNLVSEQKKEIRMPQERIRILVDRSRDSEWAGELVDMAPDNTTIGNWNIIQFQFSLSKCVTVDETQIFLRIAAQQVIVNLHLTFASIQRKKLRAEQTRQFVDSHLRDWSADIPLKSAYTGSDEKSPSNLDEPLDSP